MKMDFLFHLFVVSVCVCFTHVQSDHEAPDLECEENFSCPVSMGGNPGPPVCLSRSQFCDSIDDCFGEIDEEFFECSETPMFLCDEVDGDGFDITVTVDALCDGIKDCNNTGKDELNGLCHECLLPYYGNCSYTRECMRKDLSSNTQDDIVCGDCLPGYHDDPDNPDPAGECLEDTVLDVIEIGLESLANTVPEDVGTVEVCIVLSGSGINISSIVIRLTVVPGTAEADVDYTYSPPNGPDGDSTLTFTPSTLRQCIRIDVIDDRVVEQTETIVVSISPTEDLPDAVALINSTASLLIKDNDGNATVYFEETTYTVNEGSDGHAQICVVIEGERFANVTVTLFTADGTAEGTGQLDYRITNEELVFDHEDTKQCIWIAITDDDQVEDLEMFFVHLSTSDAEITSQDARIYIADDPTDMLVIGFEMESFTADENQFADVCAIIHNGTLETQVSVTLVTATGGLQMHFSHQNQRECVSIAVAMSSAQFEVVHLYTTDPRVSLEPRIANITWQANSGNDDGDEQTSSSDDEIDDPTTETSNNQQNNQSTNSRGFLSDGGSIFGVTFGIVTIVAGILTIYFLVWKKLCKTKGSKGITGVQSVTTSEGLIATNRNVDYNGTVWGAEYAVVQRPLSSAWDRGDEVFIVKSLAAAAEPNYASVNCNTTAGGYEHNIHSYETIAAFQATPNKEVTPLTCDHNDSESLEADGFCTNLKAANETTGTNVKSSCVTNSNESVNRPVSDFDSTADLGPRDGTPPMVHGSTPDEMQSSELQAVEVTEDYESVGQIYEQSVENYGYESMGSVYDQSSVRNGYESLGSIYDRQHSTYETLGSVYDPISLANAETF